MVRSRLRIPDYTGVRLTVRMKHEDREALRSLAVAEGITESDLVREAVSVLIAAWSDDDTPVAT
jgi:hypothetical protein